MSITGRLEKGGDGQKFARVGHTVATDPADNHLTLFKSLGLQGNKTDIANQLKAHDPSNVDAGLVLQYTSGDIDLYHKSFDFGSVVPGKGRARQITATVFREAFPGSTVNADDAE